MAKKECAQQIDGIEDLKYKQAHRLPGNDEPAFEPKTRGDNKISQIAEIEEVLEAVLMPIGGSPNQHDRRPDQFYRERDARFRWPVLTPWANDISNLRRHPGGTYHGS